MKHLGIYGTPFSLLGRAGAVIPSGTLFIPGQCSTFSLQMLNRWFSAPLLRRAASAAHNGFR